MSEPAERNGGAAQFTTIRAITVSREYGSGGREIAARLAARLSWRLIDHEVVVEVARRLGVTENDAEQRDEHAETLVDQILRSFRAVDPTPLSTLGVPEFIISPEAHDYVIALRETVLAVATTGQVVIVGRGGQAILRDWRDILHVRIVAPLEQRVIRVSQREGLDREAARQRIQRKDHEGQRYLRSTYGLRIEDAILYDIVLNTAILDLDSCVDLIALTLERKTRQLRQSPNALDPSADTAYASDDSINLSEIIPPGAPPLPIDASNTPSTSTSSDSLESQPS